MKGADTPAAAQGLRDFETGFGIPTPAVLAQACQQMLNDDVPWAENHLAAWDEVFKAFGAKPKRTPCSASALRKRVMRDGSLPPLDPVVDIYNAISIRYAIPVGGENLAAYSGAPRLTLADGTGLAIGAPLEAGFDDVPGDGLDDREQDDRRDQHRPARVDRRGQQQRERHADHRTDIRHEAQDRREDAPEDRARDADHPESEADDEAEGDVEGELGQEEAGVEDAQMAVLRSPARKGHEQVEVEPRTRILQHLAEGNAVVQRGSHPVERRRIRRLGEADGKPRLLDRLAHRRNLRRGLPIVVDEPQRLRQRMVARIDPPAGEDHRPRGEGHRLGALHHQQFWRAALPLAEDDEGRGGDRGGQFGRIGEGIRHRVMCGHAATS